MRRLRELVVLIRGGGEVASGVAHRLHRCHFRVCLAEIANPLAVCRGTTFSEAVFDGTKTIEGVTAELVPASLAGIRRAWRRSNIPLVIDPAADIRQKLKPDVVVDATMAKRNLGTRITDASLVIGAGPGFYAGRDVHIVVETNHSDSLGKVILDGEAEKNTGIPVPIGGLTRERVVWAPRPGTFTTDLQIGDTVASGQTVGRLDGLPLLAPVGGMLRGLMRSGVPVATGDKLIEVVNPSAVGSVIRDKMRAIAGGVLEAIMLRCNAGPAG